MRTEVPRGDGGSASLSRSSLIMAAILAGVLAFAGCQGPGSTADGTTASPAKSRVSGIAKTLGRIVVPAGCLYLQVRMEQILEDASSSDAKKAERLDALRPAIPASCGALVQALDRSPTN